MFVYSIYYCWSVMLGLKATLFGLDLALAALALQLKALAVEKRGPWL